MGETRKQQAVTIVARLSWCKAHFMSDDLLIALGNYGNAPTLLLTDFPHKTGHPRHCDGGNFLEIRIGRSRVFTGRVESGEQSSAPAAGRRATTATHFARHHLARPRAAGQYVRSD